MVRYGYFRPEKGRFWTEDTVAPGACLMNFIASSKRLLTKRLFSHVSAPRFFLHQRGGISDPCWQRVRVWHASSRLLSGRVFGLLKTLPLLKMICSAAHEFYVRSPGVVGRGGGTITQLTTSGRVISSTCEGIRHSFLLFYAPSREAEDLHRSTTAGVIYKKIDMYK